jgi:phosphate starvation-inducible PhoH-like protein
VDLPAGAKSGLADALEALRGVEGMAVVRFTEKDVVRHPLVARIVRAYEGRDRAARGGEELSAPGAAGSPG